MTTYVHLPQVPLTLKFEEPYDRVVAHFRELVAAAEVHRYEVDESSSVIVNYAVVAAVTLTEAHRALDVAELRRGVAATIGTSVPDDDRIEA